MNTFKKIWTKYIMVNNSSNANMKINILEDYFGVTENNLLNFDDFKSTVLFNARTVFNNNNLESENLDYICAGRKILNEEQLNYAVNQEFCGTDEEDPIIILYNKSKNMTGGKSLEFVKIKGVGKRKVRFQKNGRPYVIVKGKKLKL